MSDRSSAFSSLGSDNRALIIAIALADAPALKASCSRVLISPATISGDSVWNAKRSCWAVSDNAVVVTENDSVTSRVARSTAPTRPTAKVPLTGCGVEEPWQDAPSLLSQHDRSMAKSPCTARYGGTVTPGGRLMTSPKARLTSTLLPATVGGCAGWTLDRPTIRRPVSDMFAAVPGGQMLPASIAAHNRVGRSGNTAATSPQ